MMPLLQKVAERPCMRFCYRSPGRQTDEGPSEPFTRPVVAGKVAGDHIGEDLPRGDHLRVVGDREVGADPRLRQLLREQLRLPAPAAVKEQRPHVLEALVIFALVASPRPVDMVREDPVVFHPLNRRNGEDATRRDKKRCTLGSNVVEGAARIEISARQPCSYDVLPSRPPLAAVAHILPSNAHAVRERSKSEVLESLCLSQRTRKKLPCYLTTVPLKEGMQVRGLLGASDLGELREVDAALSPFWTLSLQMRDTGALEHWRWIPYLPLKQSMGISSEAWIGLAAFVNDSDFHPRVHVAARQPSKVLLAGCDVEGDCTVSSTIAVSRSSSSSCAATSVGKVTEALRRYASRACACAPCDGELEQQGGDERAAIAAHVKMAVSRSSLECEQLICP